MEICFRLLLQDFSFQILQWKFLWVVSILSLGKTFATIFSIPSCSKITIWPLKMKRLMIWLTKQPLLVNCPTCLLLYSKSSNSLKWVFPHLISFVRLQFSFDKSTWRLCLWFHNKKFSCVQIPMPNQGKLIMLVFQTNSAIWIEFYLPACFTVLCKLAFYTWVQWYKFFINGFWRSETLNEKSFK